MGTRLEIFAEIFGQGLIPPGTDPQRIAIEYGEERISYSELESRVLREIERLKTFVQPGDIVAVESTSSPEYVVFLLALIELKALIAPIDRQLPPSRIELFYEILRPTWRLNSEKLTQSGERRKIVPLKLNERQDWPAYIIFTSGSTGKPKPVLGSMHAVARFVRWQGREFSIDPTDRISFTTSIGFDPALREIFLPLLHGATLVIATPDEKGSSVRLWLAEKGITRANLVPSSVRLWADAHSLEPLHLKTLFLMGERVMAQFINELFQHHWGIEEIVNFYGPTETTLIKFFHRISRDDHYNEDIPVGSPIPGTRFFIVKNNAENKDWDDFPEAAVQEGEVAILTPDCSFGYLDLDEDTRKNFHLAKDNLIAYHTGDLGHVSSDGQLTIIGRMDDQIKIGGASVHPREIERELTFCSFIQDVAVVVDRRRPNKPTLAAFWVPRPEVANELLDDSPALFCSLRMPQYMMPKYWQKLDKMPLTPNGKRDDQYLIDHYLARKFA